MTALLERLNEALAGRYSVESEIGRGGMATVFLAEDIRHHRKVAIKVLHQELASAVGHGRFLNEVEIVAGLEHPHILTLIDSGEADGLLYYVMPFIEGESLRQRLEKEGQLPVEEAVRIAVEVADGLDFAHEKGIVHRDVKPGNILMSGKHAVITDFGIARAITVAQDDRLTSTGLAVGTPRYASPEQATGAETLDGRTDIYSLACVLYEALSGEIPLGGPTPQAIRVRRMDETPGPLHPLRPTVSPLLDQVIGKALATLPADRFDTAEQFAQALMVATMDATPVAQLDLASTLSLDARRRWSARKLLRAPLWLLILIPAVALGSLGVWGFAEWQTGMAEGEGTAVLQSPAPGLSEVQLTESGNIWIWASPVLSPDGRTLAYVETAEPLGEVISQSGSVNLRLMVLEIDDAREPSEPRLLTALQRCTDLEWAPDGSTLLVSGRLRETEGLFLAPPTRGRITQLSERGASRVSWSPDGDRVALALGQRRIGFVDIDGDSPAQVVDEIVLPEPFGAIRDLSWSPDGDRLAIYADSAGAPALVSVAPDGTGLESITGVGLISQVRWGGTGEHLYYSTLGRELLRIDSEPSAGSSPEILMPECRWFDLSRDGRRLVCTRISRPTRLWLVSAASPPDSILVTANDDVISRPAISPDRERVAFIQGVPEGLDLYVAELAGGAPRRLTFRGDVGGRALALAWAPDGKTIVYIAPAPDGTMAPWFVPVEGGRSVRAEGVAAGLAIAWSPARNPLVQTEDQRSWLILEPPGIPWDTVLAGRTVVSNFDLRPLTSTDSFYVGSAAVSPDGRSVAVFWARGPRLEGNMRPGWGIWTIGLADSSEVQVSRWNTAYPEAFPVSWSRAGDAIYFSRPQGTDVRRLSLATGEVTVPEMPGDACHPEPLSDGRFLCAEAEMKTHVWLIEDFDRSAD